MVNVQISYNPYTVKTEILLNGKAIDNKVSPLTYVKDKRLQEWIEEKGNWPGIFKALRNSTGEREIHIEFTGTTGDFEDMEYSKGNFGTCFDKVELIHKNKDTAKEADPYSKMRKLQELYQKLQDGPVEEFKTPDIEENFRSAINSEFRIVIVAPMSSGKSTLINSIMGRDLLPAVNQATTAVITEIKDNDQFENFLVNATDKYGKVVVKNEIATNKLISELNYKKDPNDPEGKDAFIRLIQLEGDIPNIPSDVLNTVFVDTPGGNNSQNAEHEEMMDEAINDENKSLILYVFNGAQLGTNDSNEILKKIADAMNISANGKQSRDRFLFVANRMDEFDVEKEPYKQVIKNTILPQLKSNGITEPKLFLASAQTAKLIRMHTNGERLTQTEKEDLQKFVNRFNQSERMLPKYTASLNVSAKEKLIKLSNDYSAAAAKAGSDEEKEINRLKAAEINSGIPAIEMAIKEYLDKYAIAIKIKTVHDTFMKKVIERSMIDKCESEWAKSKESFEAVKRELEEKQKKCNHDKKLQEFRDKVKSITFDRHPIKAIQAEINRKMDGIVEKTSEKIEVEKAEYYVKKFWRDLEIYGKDAQIKLDIAFNSGVKKICRDILEEYADYIRDLDSDGAFDIAGYDLKQTKIFESFDLNMLESAWQSEKYLKREDIKIGTEKVKEEGFLAVIARVFGTGGYKERNVYRRQEFVLMKELVRSQITQISHSLDKQIKKEIEDTEEKVEKLTSLTVTKLEELDNAVADLIQEIDKMLISQEELKARVETNAQKTEWIKGFVEEVNNLLAI